MNVVLSEAVNSDRQIISILPLRFSLSKTLLLGAISTAVLGLLVIFLPMEANITMGLIVLLSAGDLCSAQTLATLFFTNQENNSDSISYYGVHDTSAILQQTDHPRRKASHFYIRRPHYVDESTQLKYLSHKSVIYRIFENTLTEVDRTVALDLLYKTSLTKYLQQGLQEANRLRNQRLFATSQNQLWTLKDFLLRRLMREAQHHLYLVLSLTLAAILSFHEDFLLFFALLFLYLARTVIVISMEISSKQVFQKHYSAVSTVKYTVFRDCEKKEISLPEVVVGDLVDLTASIKNDDSLTLYFTGKRLYGDRTQQQGELQRSRMFTRRSSTQSFIRDSKQDIEPLVEIGDKIFRNKIKPNEALLVINCVEIGGMYEQWKEKHRDPEYADLLGLFNSSMTYYILVKLLILTGLFAILAYGLSPELGRENWVMLGYVSLPIPMVYSLLLSVLEAIGRSRLHASKIEVLSCELERVGCITEMTFEMSTLIGPIHKAIKEKQNIFSGSTSQFGADCKIGLADNSPQSCTSLAIYISLGSLPHASPLLTKLYKNYELEFGRVNVGDKFDEIIHQSSSKAWQCLKHQAAESNGLEKWIVHYGASIYFVLEGSFNESSNLMRSLLLAKEGQTKIADYELEGNKLAANGKILRFVLYEKFQTKDIANFREQLASSQNAFAEEKEIQYQFAGFIIYDHFIHKQSLNGIEANFEREGVPKTMNGIYANFVSHLPEIQLQGFQHLIQNKPLYFNLDSSQKANLVRDLILTHGSCLTLGGHISDRLSLSVADVSIQLQTSKDSLQSLADFIILTDEDDNSEVVSCVLTVYRLGRWCLDCMCEMFCVLSDVWVIRVVCFASLSLFIGRASYVLLTEGLFLVLGLLVPLLLSLWAFEERELTPKIRSLFLNSSMVLKTICLTAITILLNLYALSICDYEQTGLRLRQSRTATHVDKEKLIVLTTLIMQVMTLVVYLSTPAQSPWRQPKSKLALALRTLYFFGLAVTVGYKTNPPIQFLIVGGLLLVGALTYGLLKKE